MKNLKNTYTNAKKFLLEQMPWPDRETILQSYLDKEKVAADIPELFKKLLQSAQNANMKKTVIGGSIHRDGKVIGVEGLRSALYDFNPNKVLEQFDDNMKLFDHIKKTVQISGKIRTEPQSLWPKYCKSILSSAQFLSKFETGEEFFSWANRFYEDDLTRDYLPTLLKDKIDGFGYALACDFLKELGFVKYGKPDVHIVDIFVALNLCSPRSSDLQIQETIREIAKASGVEPYCVDKVFWLIGSMYFYKHLELGHKGKMGGKKSEFIAWFQENEGS